MKIDRTLFLALTGTLAAPACHGNEPITPVMAAIDNDASAPVVVASAEPAATAACLSDKGSSGKCRDGDRNCSFGQEQCEVYARYFRAEVGANAVGCVMTARDCMAVHRCGRRALARACPDSSAASFCASIQNCGESKSACEQAVSGLNGEGREAVSHCASEGECQSGVYSCIEGLLSES